MSFRFRKRLKVFKGFYINVSGSGISATAGVKGASVTFSKKGTYLNTSIPGTGISHRSKIGGDLKHKKAEHQEIEKFNRDQVSTEPIHEIKNEETDQLTSSSLKELQKELKEVMDHRNNLSLQLKKTRQQLVLVKLVMIMMHCLIVGFFVNYFKSKVKEVSDEILEMEEELKQSRVNIDMNLDEKTIEKYQALKIAFSKVSQASLIRDIVTMQAVNKGIERSSLDYRVDSSPIKLITQGVSFIDCSFEPLVLGNSNGDDIYIYPSFILVTDLKSKFGLVEFKDVKLTRLNVQLQLPNANPTDSKIIRYTYKYVNKNGSQDIRYKDNPRIPMYQFGGFKIESDSGLNKGWLISNFESSNNFMDKISSYHDIFV